MKKAANYVHGTAAEKIQYDVYQENKVLKAKKTQKSYHAVKAKAVVAIMVVFALGATTMYRYAMITDLNYQISKSNEVYNNLKKENSRLKVEVDKSINLQKIKEVAESRLGMQKPDRYQNVQISVPKSDYTKVAQEYIKENESESKLSTILNKLQKFTRLLY